MIRKEALMLKCEKILEALNKNKGFCSDFDCLLSVGGASFSSDSFCLTVYGYKCESFDFFDGRYAVSEAFSFHIYNGCSMHACNQLTVSWFFSDDVPQEVKGKQSEYFGNVYENLNERNYAAIADFIVQKSEQLKNIILEKHKNHVYNDTGNKVCTSKNENI